MLSTDTSLLVGFKRLPKICFHRASHSGVLDPTCQVGLMVKSGAGRVVLLLVRLGIGRLLGIC